MSFQAQMVLNFLRGKDPQGLRDILQEVLSDLPAEHWKILVEAVLEEMKAREQPIVRR